MGGSFPGRKHFDASSVAEPGTVRDMTDTGGVSHPNLVKGPRSRSAAGRSAPPRARGAVEAPALAVRPGTAPDRFARAMGLRHPALIFFAAVIGGIVLLAGVSILLGLLVTHVLVTSIGLGTPDEGFVRDLSHHRDGTLNTVSSVGSAVGGAPVLPILVGLIGLGFAIARRWRIAAFAVFVLIAESATYRITTLAVHRDRPNVPRLENLPVDASYPSGHTAASVAVYSGLVYLITSRFTAGTGRALAWTFAILMTTFVALSRMYRGMHHPLDVAGGVIVGIGAILVLLFACRAAGAAAEARAAGRERA
jgi:membrane-associated phospholipid phosphatase